MPSRSAPSVIPNGRGATPFPHLAFAAVAALLLACPAGSRAWAAPAPDSSRVSLLQFAVLSFEDVRVATGGRKLVIQGAAVTSDGLQLGRSAGDSRITGMQSNERLLPWSEIESVEVRRGGSGAVVLACAVAGFAIGAFVVVADAYSHMFSYEKTDGSPMLIGLVGGGALGALIDRPGPWKRVYP